MTCTKDCSVCLEPFSWASESTELYCSPCGLFCESGHFICTSDFTNYCMENVFPAVFNVRDKRGKISCPVNGCSAFFDSAHAFHILPVRERNRYLGLLGEVVSLVLPALTELGRTLQSLLNLCCPHCKNTIDPTPDACSAIMCLNCGNYYCNYCFMAFAEQDAAVNRAKAHDHVATHKIVQEGETRDAFLPISLVQEGQKAYQRGKVTQLLQLIATSQQYVSLPTNGRQLASMVLVMAYADLQLLDIDPMTIWKDVVAFISQGLVAPGSVATGSSQEGVDLTSARSLRLAFLSKNVVAARQILSSTTNETLDIDYTHREVQANGQITIDIPFVAWAALVGWDDIAIELLRRGANIMAKGAETGRTALCILIECASNSVVDIVFDILDRQDPPFNWNQVLTDEIPAYQALHVAAKFNRGQWIERLVHRNANLVAEELEYGYDPLLVAVLMKKFWAALELIRCGADAMHITSKGFCAAKVAAEKGHIHLLMAYLKLHPEVINKVVSPSNNHRLIDVAMSFDQIHVIRYLVDQGAQQADPSQPTYSPVMMAVVGGKDLMASILLEVDSPSHHILAKNRNVLFVAVEKNCLMTVLSWLKKHPDDLNAPCCTDEQLPPIFVAVLYHQYSILKTLLEMGADPDRIYDPFRLPVLIFCAGRDDLVGMQMLLQHGANITLTDKNGRNVLYTILERGSLDAFYLYLDRDPEFDINADVVHNGSGLKCLHIAVMFNHPHLVTLLLGMGADLLATTASGDTAFSLAREMKLADVEVVLMAMR